MPTITKISPQVKTAGRYNIFLDGEFAFGVSEEVLFNEKLKIGLELDAKRLEYLKTTIEKDITMERILNYLSYRPRSNFEVKKYLIQKKTEPELIDDIISKLERLGYVNDEVFTTWYIEQRRSGSKRWGKKKIYAALSNLGIDRNVIEKALHESSVQLSESNNARIEAEKIMRKMHEPDLFKAKKKLADSLTRRGYSWEIIKEIIAEIDSD